MESFKQTHNATTCGLFLELYKWQKLNNTSGKFQSIFEKSQKVYHFTMLKI